MPKETSKTKQPRINPADEVITRDKLVPFFENIKELIVSTAKGTETVLGKRIDNVEKELQLTQQALKATKDELRAEIRDTETRLTDKIDTVHIRIDDHEGRITALEAPHP